MFLSLGIYNQSINPQEIYSSYSMEKYWEDKEIKWKIKEIWARMRCGSVGKDGHEEFTEASWKCVLCCTQRETLAHIRECKDAEAPIKEEIMKKMKKWKEKARGGRVPTWKKYICKICQGV